MKRFSHIRTWVFDMDNTLYDANTYIFPEMAKLMNGYIRERLNLTQEEADALRQRFWATQGSTLGGLINEYGIDPHEFAEKTHVLDEKKIPVCPDTKSFLQDLKGDKFVLTSAPREFAERVLRQLEIFDLFQGISTIEDADFHHKHEPVVYERFIKKYGVLPAESCMFEDTVKNLAPAHAMGMTTIWLHGDKTPEQPDYVHYIDKTLKNWIEQLEKD